MKSITLAELKNTTNPFWIETKIKGNKSSWLETPLKSFSGKTFKMFGDDCLSFEQWRGEKQELPIVFVDFVSARVKIWNKETQEEENIKIIF